MLHPLIVNIVNVTLFVNISKFSKWKIVYSLTFNIAFGNTWDDNKRFSMQEKDMIEHIAAKCHEVTLTVILFIGSVSYI